MSPQELIDEKQNITQSNHTLVGKPFNICNKRLKRLADYYDYRKLGVKCGKPLNPLEELAIQLLDIHASDLKMTRLFRGLRDTNNRISK